MHSYCSIIAGSQIRKPDPAAKAIDALSMPWAQDQSYLFPPFNLIGRALSKIQVEAVKYACLIGPTWPGIHNC